MECTMYHKSASRKTTNEKEALQCYLFLIEKYIYDKQTSFKCTDNSQFNKCLVPQK